MKHFNFMRLTNLLSVSKRTLQSYRDEGRISFSQIGGKIYFKASDVEEFVKEHRFSAFRKKRIRF